MVYNLIAKLFGGKIKPSKKRREFGRAILLKKNLTIDKKYLNIKKSVWMSHEDAVVKLPKNFKILLLQKLKINYY